MVGVGAGLLALIASGTCDAGAADIAAGKAAFVRQCALCHVIDEAGANRYGPNLFGIVGRRAGSVSGFQYSPAFKSTASWEWNEDALGGWISSQALWYRVPRWAFSRASPTGIAAISSPISLAKDRKR